MALGSLGPMFSKDFGSGFVMFLIAVGLVVAGVAWLRSLKPTYHVILASASSEQQGLSSKDHDLVNRVISAISG